MYCKYSDGSLIQLVKARYARTDPQELTTYHVPLTDINGAIPLGLNWQTWTINGVITDPTSVKWRDIIWLSLDNVSWRACRVQATAFPSNMYQQSLYELTVLVSPILEGAAVRYPSSGYKFGLQSITGIKQFGNVNAYPIIHYLAPLCYAPLSNTLIDFAGQAVTFTRTAAKAHGAMTYPINTPIFDLGLYISSETAQDVATWTPPASTVRTIAMQIKQTRYPSAWAIGGGGVNLLTANQSNAETNTTGWAAANGTLTRNTSTPIAGAGDFKVVSTADGTAILYSAMVPVTSAYWYCFQSLLRATGTMWGGVSITIQWFNAASEFMSETVSASIATPTAAICVSVVGQAPSGATQVQLRVNALETAAGAILYADSLMLETIPAVLTVWTAAHNKLTILTTWNVLRWTDDTTYVEATFSTAAYLNGAVTDIAALNDGNSAAVTVIAHAAGCAWFTSAGTLAAIWWPPLTLGNLEGSISNLIEYPYVLTSAEYQALAYSSLSLLYNTLFIGNRYAGEIIKGSDKRLLNANGSDISALLGGVDIPIGSAAVTIAQSQGLSARWYVELKRTDV